MNELSAEVRRVVSKSARSALRRAGRVPAILYGKGRDPLPLSVEQKELVKLIRAHRESGLVNLTISDTTSGGSSTQQQAIYKEVRNSTLKRQITHIDFQAIREGEKVHIRVAVVTKGNPIGVTVHGGVLVNTIQELDIRVLPQDIPEQIDIDVSKLDIGDAIHLKDLKLAEGIEILHDLDAIVASVTHVKEEKAAPVAAEATPAEGAAATPAAGAAPAKDAKGGAAPAKDAKAAPAKKDDKKK